MSWWYVGDHLQFPLLNPRGQTHNVLLVNNIARYVVTLDSEGQVQSHRPEKVGDGGDTNVTDMNQNKKLEVDVPPSDSTSTSGNMIPSGGTEGGMLTKAEEIAEGHVGWSAGKLNCPCELRVPFH